MFVYMGVDPLQWPRIQEEIKRVGFTHLLCPFFNLRPATICLASPSSAPSTQDQRATSGGRSVARIKALRRRHCWRRDGWWWRTEAGDHMPADRHLHAWPRNLKGIAGSQVMHLSASRKNAGIHAHLPCSSAVQRRKKLNKRKEEKRSKHFPRLCERSLLSQHCTVS